MTHRVTPSRRLLRLFASMLLALAGTQPIGVRAAGNPAPADPALLPVYHQFGDNPGLARLMDEFMVELLADPRTHKFFAEADQVRIKDKLVEQFCVILGGPCTYTGKDMALAHRALALDEAAFNALVEDLQVAMDRQHIPFRAQNVLLARLAPMHRDVINKP